MSGPGAARMKNTISGNDFEYRVRRPFFIPKQRYFDEGFYQRELDHLWPRTWQTACRVEEIPNVGDYTEYKIAGQSILIVRSDKNEIHALSNVCRHRGRILAEGSGTLRGKITCGFHGWRWNLDGSNDYVYGPQGFSKESISKDYLDLPKAAVAVWGGFVWINLNPDAEPFEDFISPVKGLLDPHALDRMQVLWWQSAVIDANWKLPLEAFIEGYHIRYTHPQSNFGSDINPDYMDYRVLGRGHSVFSESAKHDEHMDEPNTGMTPGEILVKRFKGVQRTFNAIVTPRDVFIMESIAKKAIPKGSNIRQEHVRAFREFCQSAGIVPPDLGAQTTKQYGAPFTLFPNMVVVPWFGNAWIGRTRPISAEKCYFDMWSVTLQPESRPAKRPEHLGYFRPDDTKNWLIVPRQDYGNVEPQQRAMRTFGFDELHLSNKWEININELHREIDQYLAGQR